MATPVEPLVGEGALSLPQRAVHWAGFGLIAASWLSAALFGAYILAFYLGAIPSGHLENWNQNLPGLYARGNDAALASMTAHLAAGAIILLLGPIQLIGGIRRRWPSVHRWLGRVYVVTAGIAGLGGLAFIFFKGTIGGAPMNAGFGLYGILVVVSAIQAWRNALARRFDRHRAWAIRLFALAIGSWLYRMDYGFWLIAAHGVWHTGQFRGPFDVAMSFLFYLPNLGVAELFLRGKQMKPHPVLLGSAAAVLGAAALVVAVGTYYFLHFYWGPAILNALSG
ncbi:MAG: DUF2306 domain-containing protein [Terracidiphilus sp.]